MKERLEILNVLKEKAKAQEAYPAGISLHPPRAIIPIGSNVGPSYSGSQY
jgi:hypothetical protein